MDVEINFARTRKKNLFFRDRLSCTSEIKKIRARTKEIRFLKQKNRDYVVTKRDFYSQLPLRIVASGAQEPKLLQFRDKVHGLVFFPRARSKNNTKSSVESSNRRTNRRAVEVPRSIFQLLRAQHHRIIV